MGRFLKSLWREEDGQDMVEYALLFGFMVLRSHGGHDES